MLFWLWTNDWPFKLRFFTQETKRIWLSIFVFSMAHWAKFNFFEREQKNKCKMETGRRKGRNNTKQTPWQIGMNLRTLIMIKSWSELKQGGRNLPDRNIQLHLDQYFLTQFNEWTFMLPSLDSFDGWILTFCKCEIFSPTFQSRCTQLVS